MAENTNVMVVNNNAKLPLVIEENSLFAYFEKIKKIPCLDRKRRTRPDYRF